MSSGACAPLADYGYSRRAGLCARSLYGSATVAIKLPSIEPHGTLCCGTERPTALAAAWHHFSVKFIWNTNLAPYRRHTYMDAVLQLCTVW